MVEPSFPVPVPNPQQALLPGSSCSRLQECGSLGSLQRYF